MLNEIIWPVVALGGLGLVFGLGLAVAAKLLSVETNPNIEKIRELLPGANCGGCGFPGCDGFAQAAAEGNADISLCNALSNGNFAAITQLLGVNARQGERKVARVLCHGDSENCSTRFKYSGISDCRAAATLAGGPSACPYSCVGLLTCAHACPFDAIYLNERGLTTVDELKCTGCGKCIEVCPKNSIVLMPRRNDVYVSCRTPLKGKAVTTICRAGCIGCSLCVKKCPENAITMQDNLPVIDYAVCTGCGTCVAVCPKQTFVAAGPGKTACADQGA